MSIEKALEVLGEKIDRNSDLLEKVLSSGTGGKAAAAEEEAPRRRGRAAAEEKPAEEAAPRSRRGRAEAEEETTGRKSKDADEAPRRSRRGADADAPADKPAGRAKKPAKLKIADVRAAFADFLDVKDKKEEEDRRAFIEEILDFLKVDKTTDIAEADFQGAIDVVKAFDEAKDPDKIEIGDFFPE